jgi:hypothetical protein
MRRLLSTVAASACLALGAGADASATGWENVPLPPPPGGQFSVPVGLISDLSFFAPNRGLMTVAGNSSVPGGLYSWDGVSWHQLSTVCGGGPNARIAWAGPTEFWTITRASVTTSASGEGLCHFKDGVVVGSYSFYNVPSFGSPVNAAACRTANDCWFGGRGTESADGSQVGAFHLHWDGSELQPVYNGQGRGVSDLVAHRGSIFESTYVGPGVTDGSAPFLQQPEPTPSLLHRIDGLGFANDPFAPAVPPDVPADGTELRSMDSDGSTAWAVGGGALSGPSAREGQVRRTPVAARRDGDGAWQELPLSGDLPTTSWFGAVGAVPGTREAWATLTNAQVGGTFVAGESAAPSVAHIAADGTVAAEVLDAREGAAARGAATAIACPAADDCWAATARGYLYRRTTAGVYPRDTDPAFQGTITIRPNEAAEQRIPDEPPADDSRLLAPPVVLPPSIAEVPPTPCPAPPALVSRVTSSLKKLTRKQRRQKNALVTLNVRFRLARPAAVGLTARRGKRTVARAKARTFRPGTRTLTVKVRRKSFPKAISFSLKELSPPACGPGDDGGGDGDTVVVG